MTPPDGHDQPWIGLQLVRNERPLGCVCSRCGDQETVLPLEVLEGVEDGQNLVDAPICDAILFAFTRSSNLTFLGFPAVATG
jgi:hypothetical protein